MDSDGAKEADGVGAEARAVFDSLFEPHEQFHSASSLALQTHDTGDDATSTRAVTDMHRLSSLLVSRLLELDRLAATKK